MKQDKTKEHMKESVTASVISALKKPIYGSVQINNTPHENWLLWNTKRGKESKKMTT
jgi:hypothetical protein